MKFIVCRTESEKENRERRSELQRQERRLQQKEESLDKKTDNIEKKEEALRARQKEIENRMNEAEELKKRQFEMLERISGLTTEQAKDYLLKNLEGELDHDKAVLIRNYEQKLKEEADAKEPSHFIPVHTTLCSRPFLRGDRFGGSAAQR